MLTYEEEDKDLHVTYRWHNSRCLHRQTTHRGTLLEIIDRPVWGLTCYMDGIIQSCELDQELYHSALVNAAFRYFVRSTNATRVCILGGGEGATAKKVLEWTSVGRVDMIEWDRDVLDLFQNRFSMWGSWDDERLTVYEEDVFEAERRRRSYHIVIADLFDLVPKEADDWIPLLQPVGRWAKYCFTLYVGTHAPFLRSSDPVVRKVRRTLREMGFATHLSSIYIPSFHGYAVFLTGVR
jgi:spermidine synthase